MMGLLERKGREKGGAKQNISAQVKSLETSGEMENCCEYCESKNEEQETMGRKK